MILKSLEASNVPPELYVGYERNILSVSKEFPMLRRLSEYRWRPPQPNAYMARGA